MLRKGIRTLNLTSFAGNKKPEFLNGKPFPNEDNHKPLYNMSI